MSQLKVLMIGPGAPNSSNAGLGIVVEKIKKGLDSKAELVSVEPEESKASSKTVTPTDFDEKAIVKDLVRVVVKEKIDPYTYYTSPQTEKTETIESEVRELHRKYSESVVESTIDQDCDVIYVHDWVGIRAGLELKKELNKPLVLHIHSLDTDRIGANHKSWVFDLEKEAIDKADAIIAVSKYTADCIIKQYDGVSEKITVVYPGVESLKEIAFNPIDPTVLFLGRFASQKSPLKFIEIAERVLESKPDTHFLMVGDGELKNEAIEKVAQKGLGSRVHFSDFVDHDRVKDAFARSTVFCMPSDSEPFGMAAVEAADFGLPIVISEQSGAREVLKGAITVEKDDIQGFSKAILQALRSNKAIKEAITVNRAAVNDLSWESSIESIFDVLNSAR